MSWKYGSLKPLQPPGPVQVCAGIAFIYFIFYYKNNNVYFINPLTLELDI